MQDTSQTHPFTFTVSAIADCGRATDRARITMRSGLDLFEATAWTRPGGQPYRTTVEPIHDSPPTATRRAGRELDRILAVAVRGVGSNG